LHDGKKPFAEQAGEKGAFRQTIGESSDGHFSSSVTSIEGHNFALIITDDCTGYRWLYGLKTKDDILKAIKKWHSDIAELRETHTVIMVMRDNAGENKSLSILLNHLEFKADIARPMSNGRMAKLNLPSIP
jgi:hypothetical protein